MYVLQRAKTARRYKDHFLCWKAYAKILFKFQFPK